MRKLNLIVFSLFFLFVAAPVGSMTDEATEVILMRDRPIKPRSPELDPLLLHCYVYQDLGEVVIVASQPIDASVEMSSIVPASYNANSIINSSVWTSPTLGSGDYEISIALSDGDVYYGSLTI